MAALVQTIPQQNGTVTLLQTRPASSSTSQNYISAPSITQPHVGRGHSMSLSSYNGVTNPASSRNSVAPYAFTSTPGLLAANGNSNQQRHMAWSPQVRPDSHHSSTSLSQNNTPNHSSHFAAGSVSSSSGSSNSSARPSYISQDDSILSSRRRTTDMTPRPLSTINLSTQSNLLTLSTSISSTTPSPSSTPSPSTSTPSKPLPDRYRRVKRTATEDNTNQAAVPIPNRSSSYDLSATAVILPQPSRPTIITHTRTPSADDTRVGKQSHPDVAKRYRRRSWANMDAFSQESPLDSSLFAPLPDLKFNTPELSRPASSHSERSRPVEHSQSDIKTSVPSVDSKTSSNASHNPSPLSHQVTNSPLAKSESPAPSNPPSSTLNSPAAQRLADISKASGKKPGKSRLRRAFSFGSAAELRKVSVQNSMGRREGEQSTNIGDELDPEQAAIAAQQEANGLGNSIYSHQLGSTDNLSISSTASSASIMLRKMGRGMKKSTRSLVGLFRPKSVINESTDPVIIEPTAPQLSVVNIEAERKIVAVNPDPREQSGGGTVFPKVQPTKEKSKTTAVVNERNLHDSNSRKSIVGGERERAEVLAAVKKGILKRSGSSSPVGKPVELAPPHIPDSPNSSAPSTPEEHSHRVGHRRTDTVKIEGEDYFMTQGKYGSESKTTPITPHPASKSIVFSPRIQFYETWPSVEYDRRGDTATCNKLTPLLAQQIKEELNTFKMEMEVHETSKIYTHFL
ncbi:conserved hypothetical protein [Talaromyces stipitatus ATCC 10500]|uniref:Protein BNI4 n=1 Tax=Talaromyces stipitatus (strain ATCC 10500 / CBS 375.48 / QM 6759 / NRRL 1006) TaxID=441959 RepID=B8M3E7_TALSN|nr:uncharacterized protein TSTA_095680 [Talaromyces stipitatus ATCC 10500]EED22319.1 conserved hypothetical protein [Talaromyces stipitatus ATCC 10500]